MKNSLFTRRLALIILCVCALVVPLVLANNWNRRGLPLHKNVLEIIRLADSIPGFEAAWFCELKPELTSTWETLVQKGKIQRTGRDEEIRPTFVALQALVESVLSQALTHDIKSLVGIIHTPMPPTPLCTAGEISAELVSPAIERDPKRVATVKLRTAILRDFLHQGGYLYCVYPESGMAKRSEQQQKIYREELLHFSHVLFDLPLKHSSIPADLIGATYFFTDQKGTPFVFAIQMTQANDPKEEGHFGLWFGSLQNQAVRKRVEAIVDFIEIHEPGFRQQTEKLLR